MNSLWWQTDDRHVIAIIVLVVDMFSLHNFDSELNTHSSIVHHTFHRLRQKSDSCKPSASFPTLHTSENKLQCTSNQRLFYWLVNILVYYNIYWNYFYFICSVKICTLLCISAIDFIILSLWFQLALSWFF